MALVVAAGLTLCLAGCGAGNAEIPQNLATPTKTPPGGQPSGSLDDIAKAQGLKKPDPKVKVDKNFNPTNPGGGNPMNPGMPPPPPGH